MKIAILVALTFLMKSSNCQTFYKQQNFEHTIYGLTTIVKTTIKDVHGRIYKMQGTGFFYHKNDDKKYATGDFDYTVNSVDSNLKSIWLVTNKHVLVGKNYKAKNADFPETVEFYLRKRVKNLEVPLWDTILLNKKYLERNTRFHFDSTTDVVAINISSIMLPILSKKDSQYYYSGISKANFPTISLDDGSAIGVGYEIMAIGYPKEFYDSYNLFPTVKSGILASKWNTKYDGHHFFLIDCKLFPGSSGSIIISKKVTYAGKTSSEDFDYFQFLGVYSGEFYRLRETVEFEEMTITRKENYNTGNVWYYYLIEEIIK